MLYLANPSSDRIKEKMRENVIGMINTPRQGSLHVEGATWCADNSCFGKGFPGYDRWLKWLERMLPHQHECVFATAPDVVGDHHATVERSAPWLPKIRELGYKAAFVAQDGSTPENTPWETFDALFVGGTTEFKLGPEARAMIFAAKERGMWVHVGRVNSRKRYKMFATLEHNGKPACDSCDGTYLAFGPDINLPKLLSWVEEHKSQMKLGE